MAFERLIAIQAETRKILWLFGIAFGLFLLAQHFELPYGYVMSSLLTAAKSTGFSTWSKKDANGVANLAMSTSGESLQRKNDTGSVSRDNAVRLSVVPAAISLSTLPSRKFSPESASPRETGFKSRVPVVSLCHNTTTLDDNKQSSSSTNKNPKLPQSGLPLVGQSSLGTKIPAAKLDSFRRPKAEMYSIQEMNDMLLQNYASSLSVRPLYSSAGDQELLSAKSQIENAPVVGNYPGLYSPVYRNLSTFKRSYDLMEQMLKVYIYKEGKRPVFHQPRLTGIYASEGWFMKILEASRQYVAKNPEEAHLFYLPFTSQMLEEALYIPNSHSFDNLIQYLKDYLDLIKARYAFWNRTSGADHFLVGCHDWAPAETRQDMANCIRALCNADLKEGFELGKDVSLPETYVHSAKYPSRGTGGKPPFQRHILAFFAGQMHGYVRPFLLKHWENKYSGMHIFGRMHKGNYIEHMRSSKYCICPRGYEVNSPRVVEAIINGCVPVIISDNFVPPFFEVLNWESFAVFVPEKDIPNLKNILLSISERRYLVMQYRVKRVMQHFLWHSMPEKYDVFHMILHSIWYNRVLQMHS